MDSYVKNGTPLHGPSLCTTCENAMIVKGYRESQEIVICDAKYPSTRVTFAVRECTRFLDKTREELEELKKIAWEIVPRGPKRAAGFVVSPETADGAAGAREIEIVLDRQNDETEPAK